jgi:hypothetical protein
MNKPDNSQECYSLGYEMSDIFTEIAVSGDDSDGIKVIIGCDNDDEFYDKSGKSGRVKISLYRDDPFMEYAIDLEDILVFAKTYCNGIYERIHRDVVPMEEKEHN